jgi:hypothetical protein
MRPGSAQHRPLLFAAESVDTESQQCPRDVQPRVPFSGGKRASQRIFGLLRLRRSVPAVPHLGQLRFRPGAFGTERLATLAKRGQLSRDLVYPRDHDIGINAGDFGAQCILRPPVALRRNRLPDARYLAGRRLPLPGALDGLFQFNVVRRTREAAQGSQDFLRSAQPATRIGRRRLVLANPACQLCGIVRRLARVGQAAGQTRRRHRRRFVRRCFAKACLHSAHTSGELIDTGRHIRDPLIRPVEKSFQSPS